MEEIEALRERIWAATMQVPWIPTLRQEAHVRNAHSFTAIEGNPLSLNEVRGLEEGKTLPKASPRARHGVLNHLVGLQFICH